MKRFGTVCVDASIVVRRVAAVVDSDVSDLWAQWEERRVMLVAPSMLHYEVANALHQYRRGGSRSTTALLASLRAALALPITLHDDDSMHELATDIAGRFSLRATYDAHYLALAERLGAEFWTADKRLAHAVRPDLNWVRLLGE